MGGGRPRDFGEHVGGRVHRVGTGNCGPFALSRLIRADRAISCTGGEVVLSLASRGCPVSVHCAASNSRPATSSGLCGGPFTMGSSVLLATHLFSKGGPLNGDLRLHASCRGNVNGGVACTPSNKCCRGGSICGNNNSAKLLSKLHNNGDCVSKH